MLTRFNCVQLFTTIARQASLSMGFSRQKYWSGLPCPPPGDLYNPEIKPSSLVSPALAGVFFTTSATWEAHEIIENMYVGLCPGSWHRVSETLVTTWMIGEGFALMR